MNEPVDSSRALKHITDLIEATGVTLTAVARAARVSRESVYRISRAGVVHINAEIEARILALTPEDLLIAEPVINEMLLHRLLRGEDVALPAGQKHGYHVALRRHGWNKAQIAEATKSSRDHVRASLLHSDLSRVRLDAIHWADAYHSVVRREKSWQEYARRLEAALAKAEACRIPAVTEAIRGALRKEAS